MDITKYLKNKDIELSNDDINVEKLEKDIRKGYVLSEEVDNAKNEALKESTSKYTELETKYNNLEKNMDKIIEQTVNKEVEKAVKQVHVENEQLKLEVARLKGLLNMNSTNSGISTSKIPINQKKHIPNSRKKSDKKIGGQLGHKKNKLNAFTEEEITEKYFHELKHCICGGKLDKIGKK